MKLDIIYHNDEIVIAFSGPCPDEFEYALDKAKASVEGYGVVKNAAFAEYLPGQLLSRWNTELGIREGETTVLEQLQAEKASLESSIDILNDDLAAKDARLKVVEKAIKDLTK